MAPKPCLLNKGRVQELDENFLGLPMKECEMERELVRSNEPDKMTHRRTSRSLSENLLVLLKLYRNIQKTAKQQQSSVLEKLVGPLKETEG